MVKKTNRRNFLRNAGAFLAGAVAASYLPGCGAAVQTQHPEQARLDHLISSYDGSNLVQPFMQSFSLEIPGASRIVKRLTPGAKHGLVQIKNRHYYHRSNARVLRETEAIQDDVGSVLRHLIDHNGLQSVYQEAYLVGENNPFQRLAVGCERDRRETDALHQEIRRYEEMLRQHESRTIHRRLDEAQENFEQMQRDNRECREDIDRGIRYSAVNRLMIQGLIDTQATETREIYDRSMEAENNLFELDLDEPDAERIYAVRKQLDESNRERERFILQEVVRNGDGIGTIVLGGTHNLGPDIDEWNQSNPDNIFDLIEIIPTAYERYTRTRR